MAILFALVVWRRNLLTMTAACLDAAPSWNRARAAPPDEVERRLAGLQATLGGRGLDAVLVLQNADLYYYSGTVQQSFLYVPADGRATLFVRKVVERARLESPLEHIVALRGVRELPGAVAERYGRLPARMGLELDCCCRAGAPA